jgi:hypothetical protein
MLGGVHSAHAHGIAGNRFFPGTLAFDDPAITCTRIPGASPRGLGNSTNPLRSRRRGDREAAFCTDVAASAHGRLWHGAADSECPLFGR